MKVDLRPNFEKDMIDTLSRGPGNVQKSAALALAAYGATDAVIATALAISQQNLAEFFEAELRVGRAKKFCNVILALYDAAETGSVPAIRMLLRTAMPSAERELRKETPRKSRPKRRNPSFWLPQLLVNSSS